MALEKLLGHTIRDQPVDVVTTEVGVARGRDHLDHVTRQIQDRDIEGATAEVVHSDALTRAGAIAVGQRGCGRLVEDAQDIEAGNAPRIPRGRPLQLVEVGRHGHHGVDAALLQLVLCDRLEAPQHEGSDLRERVGLPANVDNHAAGRPLGEAEGQALLGLANLRATVRTPDQPLGREHRVGRVDQAPLFGRAPDQDFPVGVEGDHRRRQLHASRIVQHLYSGAIGDRDDRIRRAEI